MRIFKNEIDVKWLLLVIGIVTGIGYAVATTNPIISNVTSYLDTLVVTNSVTANSFSGSGTGLTGVILTNPISVQKITTNSAGDFAEYYQNNAPTGVGGFVFFDNTSVSKGGCGYWNDPSATYGGFQLKCVSFTGSGFGFDRIIINSIPSTSGTDDIACIDPSSKELTKNTGSATTCAVSAEKYKDIKGTFNDTMVQNKFSQLHPIVFTYKDDIKKLDKFGFNANEIAVSYPQVVYTRYQGNGTFVKLILNLTNPNKADAIQYSDGVIADIEGINYEMFSAILVNQAQDQQFQLDIQSAQIRKICTNQPTLCS